MQCTLDNHDNLPLTVLWNNWLEKHRSKFLILLVLLALAVRWRAAVLELVAQRDAIFFTSLAQQIYQGNWRAVLLGDQHPLFPAMIAGFYHLVGDWLTTAQLIAILADSLVMLPLFWLTRKLGGIRAALISGGIYALHPNLVHYAAGGLSEPLLLFCLVWAAALGWLAIEGNVAAGLAAGILIGGAYLDRPEGMVAGLVMALALLLLSQRPQRAWVALGLLVLGFLLTGGPYIYYLSRTTGYLTLSIKKHRLWCRLWGIAQPWQSSYLLSKQQRKALKQCRGKIRAYLMARLAQEQEEDDDNRKIQKLDHTYYPPHLRKKLSLGDKIQGLCNGLFKGLFYPMAIALVLIVAIMLLWRWAWPGKLLAPPTPLLAMPVRLKRYFLLFIVMFSLLIAVVEISSDYQSKRRFVTLLPFVLPWVALAPEVIAGLARPWWLRLILFFCLLQLLFNFLPFKTFKIHGKSGLDEKNVGEYLQAVYGPHQHILTHLNRVSFYARAHHVELTRYTSLVEIVEKVLRYHIQWIVLEKRESFKITHFLKWGLIRQVYPLTPLVALQSHQIAIFKVNRERFERILE